MSPSGASGQTRLTLLDGFELTFDGRVLLVVAGSQRLLALLALSPQGMNRAQVVTTLWPNRERRRGFANLRSALWRLPSEARGAVHVNGDRLSLEPSVKCDVIELRERISRLTGGSEVSDGDDLDVTRFIADLLPAWYEDWVLAERERLRHCRIQALEVLCERLTTLGRFGEAIEAGLAAVTAEPLRESAHRVLITAHMAEGNRSEAQRQYDLYVNLLHQDLGVSPSPELRRLVTD